MSTKDKNGRSHRHNRCPKLANTAFLSSVEKDVNCKSFCNKNQSDKSPNAKQACADISNQQDDDISGMSCVRQTMINSGLEVDTTNITMASWRPNNTVGKLVSMVDILREKKN